MVPLMYGKEHGLLKERMPDMEMNVEQELGIGPEVHKSGSLCEAFFCPDIVQNVNARGTIYSMWIILRKCEGGCEARLVRSREQIW